MAELKIRKIKLLDCNTNFFPCLLFLSAAVCVPCSCLVYEQVSTIFFLFCFVLSHTEQEHPSFKGSHNYYTVSELSYKLLDLKVTFLAPSAVRVCVSGRAAT